MRISPREAKSQISNMIDNFLTASRGEKLTKLNRTHDETAELIASMQFAQLFPQVCGRLYKFDLLIGYFS